MTDVRCRAPECIDPCAAEAIAAQDIGIDQELVRVPGCRECFTADLERPGRPRVVGEVVEFRDQGMCTVQIERVLQGAMTPAILEATLPRFVGSCGRAEALYVGLLRRATRHGGGRGWRQGVLRRP